MEKMDEKVKRGIKKERLQALKGNYQKAELINFSCKNKAVGGCSDMASATASNTCYDTGTTTCSFLDIYV